MQSSHIYKNSTYQHQLLFSTSTSNEITNTISTSRRFSVVSTWRNIGRMGWSALGRQNPGIRTGPPCMCGIKDHNLNRYNQSTVDQIWNEIPCIMILGYLTPVAIWKGKNIKLTFFFLRSLSLAVETASRTSFIYEGRTSLGTEPTTLNSASQAACRKNHISRWNVISQCDRADFHLRITATVAESWSLSKTIKLDIMFGASSTRYNLLFWKKYPIRYEELLLIEPWKSKSFIRICVYINYITCYSGH